jgi:hypothetical protein
MSWSPIRLRLQCAHESLADLVKDAGYESVDVRWGLRCAFLPGPVWCMGLLENQVCGDTVDRWLYFFWGQRPHTYCNHRKNRDTAKLWRV